MPECRICEEEHAPGSFCRPVKERIPKYVAAAKAALAKADRSKITPRDEETDR